MGEPWEYRSRRFTSSAAVGFRRPGSAEPTLTARSRSVSPLLVVLTARLEYAPSCATTALAVSKKTVEALMARQGLQGRVRKPRRGLIRANAQAEELPDPLKRDFTAGAGEPEMCRGFQADRHRRAVRCSSRPSRICSPDGRVGFAQSDRHLTAELATAAT